MTSQQLFLVIAIAAPTLFWFAYHHYKDRYQPEPILALSFAYLIGIGAALTSHLIYTELNALNLFLDSHELTQVSQTVLYAYSIGVIGGVEEGVKLALFLFYIRMLPHFDEPVDGIIYAAMIALGFASYENIGYLPYLDTWPALGRAFASPMVHILFASIWGYAYSHAHFGSGAVIRWTLGGFVIACVAHGIYDAFSIVMSPWTQVVPALIILVIWILRMMLIRQLHRNSGHIS